MKLLGTLQKNLPGLTFSITSLSLRSTSFGDGRGEFRGEHGGAPARHPPLPHSLYFLQSLGFLRDHFEELQTVLFEVKLIINSTFTIRLRKYYPNMFNIQSFVIWQTVNIFF